MLVGREDRLERQPLHRANRRANGWVDRTGAAARPVHPRAEVELDRTVAVARVDEPVLLGVEPLELFRLGPAAQRRREEDERRDATRVREREVERNPKEAPTTAAGASSRRSMTERTSSTYEKGPPMSGERP
ncbi:MAG TPA: hypothetical protein VHF67_06835 [Gaiellaceae bacterium]|nr:hypothetical protein [Gaiellaceae bacterium]